MDDVDPSGARLDGVVHDLTTGRRRVPIAAPPLGPQRLHGVEKGEGESFWELRQILPLTLQFIEETVWDGQVNLPIRGRGDARYHQLVPPFVAARWPQEGEIANAVV